jgi:hypothetical protein
VAVSANGRFVTFASAYPGYASGDTNGVADVFRRDMVAATTARWSLSAAGDQLARGSGGGAMPADGGAVVFVTAGAAVPSDTNAAQDVFLRR